MRTGTGQTWVVAAAVLLGAAAMLALRAGARGYENHDVTRYAQMAFEMRHAGSLLPTVDGRPYHEAMPLPGWATLVVANLAGEVTPLSGRVFPALSALAMAAVTFFLARRHGSERLGLLAAGIVALTPLTLAYGRCSRIDITLGFAVAAAVGACFEGARDPERRWRSLGWFSLAGVALALGIAAKGPLAAVIVIAAVGPFLVYERRFGALFAGGAAVLVVAAALTAAWLIPYIDYLGPKQARAFFDQFLLRENLAKLEDGYGKGAPPYMYLVEFFPKFAPFSILSALFLGRVLRRPGGASPLGRLSASWVIFPFALFSIATGKHIRYLIPLIPPLAILAAAELDLWLDAPAPAARRALAIGARVLAVAVLAAGIAAPIAFAAVVGPSGYAISIGLAAAAGGAGALVLLRRGRVAASLLPLYLAAAASVTFIYAAVFPLPEVERHYSSHFQVAEAIADFRDRGPIAVVDPADPALERHDRLDPYQLGLYLGVWVEGVSSESPPANALLLARRAIAGRPVLREVEVSWRRGTESVRWLLLGPLEAPRPVPSAPAPGR